MKLHLRPLAAALFAILVALPAATSARAQSFNGNQRTEIEGIIREYLLSHPELMQDVMSELDKRQATADAEKHRTAVSENSATIFTSPRQITLGNPQGDVTLVEFFDYNCGFCKRALPDTLALLKNDPKLKIVLKEFPILGPGSAEAARVAVAVRMQDPGGQKYLAFHQELLGGPGPASKDKALAAAKDQGLDMARLTQDMMSDEVNATLAENLKLANALGVTGTPSYIVGKNVVIGAVGVASLTGQIDAARGHAAN
jgi:protein-disulfide isomerase